MRILKITPFANGGHDNDSPGTPRPIPDGWAVVPDDLETPNFPFGDITVEDQDGLPTVTSWTPLPMPEPEPEPEAYSMEDVMKAMLGG